jgi:aminomethyltransferase
VTNPAPLDKTPLHALHLELGARMVPFAGYELPVQFPQGIIAEHRWCRESAALFDVSHMGQLRLEGPDAAAALETLVPMDIAGLAPFKQRYCLLTNPAGGILDDLMVARRGADLRVVVNAACKRDDTRHLIASIGHRCAVVPLPDQALLALQGPKAVAALSQLAPGVANLRFMDGGDFTLAGAPCFVTRSGYTGEDGFEISVGAAAALDLARALLAMHEVRPAGLGARDTLRLEAGLCLYGRDIDATTTPIEAGLAWAIQKVRRPGGARAGGYPGADVVEAQLAGGAKRRRVGLVALERVPVREGTSLVEPRGRKIGHVTSGTLAPSVDQPIAMGWLGAEHAQLHHEVYAEVRGRHVPMRVSAMPFQPHRYWRG